MIVPNYAKVIFVIFEFNFQSSIITVNAVNSIVQTCKIQACTWVLSSNFYPWDTCLPYRLTVCLRVLSLLYKGQTALHYRTTSGRTHALEVCNVPVKSFGFRNPHFPYTLAPVLSTVLPPAPQFLLLWIATVEDYLVLSFLALTVLELFKSQSPIGLALAPRAQSRLPFQPSCTPCCTQWPWTPLYAKDYTTW